MKKFEQKQEVDIEYLDMMVCNFNYSIDNNLNEVYLGYTILEDESFKEFWVEKKNWILTIDILMKNAIKLEEYEYAGQLKEIKEKLDNE